MGLSRGRAYARAWAPANVLGVGGDVAGHRLAARLRPARREWHLGVASDLRSALAVHVDALRHRPPAPDTTAGPAPP